MVAGFVSGLASGLVGAFTQSNALDQQVALQKDLMKYQAKVNYNYSQKDLKTKWLANRTGLENAGYNPMLALSGVNSNSQWTSPQSVSDNGAGANSIMATGQGLSYAVDQQNADTNRLNASTQENLSNAEATKARAEASLIDEKIISEMGYHIRQEIENANLPTYLKKQLENLQSSTDYNNIRSKLEAFRAETERINAVSNAKSVEVQRRQANASIDYLKRQGALTDNQARMLQEQIKWLPADKIIGYMGTLIQSFTGLGITGSMYGNLNTNKGRLELDKERFNLDKRRFEYDTRPNDAYNRHNIGF